MIYVNRIEQNVVIELFDQNEQSIGKLIINAIMPFYSNNAEDETKFKNFVTKTMELKNIPKVEDPDNKTPIQYNQKKDLNSGARIMLLEETGYQVMFKLNENMKVLKEINIFPTIKREDEKSVSFEQIRIKDEKDNRTVSGILNFHGYVGKSFFDIMLDGKRSKPHPFEVRSKKIGYEDQYPSMIGDLSKAASGLIFEFSSPLYQWYDFGDKSRDTLYQDFMFLEYLFRPNNLPHALDIIRKNIYNRLETYKEEVPVSLVSSISPEGLIEMVSSPNNLIKKEEPPLNWPLEMKNYIPIVMIQQCSKENIDTPENRLVKAFLHSLDMLIIKLKRSTRYLNEVKPGMGYIDSKLIEYCQIIHEYISEDWLVDIGQLEYIPSNSQILQKREGYREIFQFFLNFEFAFRLHWLEVEENIKGYNQKLNQLYEYWCFFKIIKAISRITNEQIFFEDLFETTNNKWNIQLKRGNKSKINFTLNINGKNINLSVMYNRLFSKNTKNRSYSLPFKPDYTIYIKYGDRESFLHFDAKYRSEGEILDFYEKIGSYLDIDNYSDLLNKDNIAQKIIDEEKLADDLDTEEQICRSYKAGDIYKMHTYRDAILKTEGAYILYPGDIQKIFFMDENETIPSVGAFPLTPGKNGIEDQEIEMFIRAILRTLIDKYS